MSRVRMLRSRAGSLPHISNKSFQQQPRRMTRRFRAQNIKDKSQKRFERDMAKIIGLIDAPPFAVRDQSCIAKFERISVLGLSCIKHPTELLRIWRAPQYFRDLEHKEQRLRPK